jgi:two-component system NtrC family response regulator
MPARILIVDDEIEMGNFFKFLLGSKGYEVSVAENGKRARELFQNPFHLALLDLKLPDTDGLTLLREFKAMQPQCEALVMTGYSTIKSAVEAIQLGAFDYLEKPFEDLEALEEIIGRALNRALASGDHIVQEDDDRKKIMETLGFVPGQSECMRRLLMIAGKLARKHITLLLRGETGTGKEVLARYIHAVSPRASQPFLAVNCGALPENLLESELFGHEKGAFTGASGQHKGIFELAHRGTLFLDEIGDASLAIQVKLLRVLESGEIVRVGGEKPVRVDTRVIAATNAPLEQLVKERRFREDLFYRLDVVTLALPPLRERRDDACLLAEHFLAGHYQPGQAPQLGREVCAALTNFDWPGNIRELSNVMAQVAALCDAEVVLPEHLPLKLQELAGGPGASSPERRWLRQINSCLEDMAEQVDIAAGFELQVFMDELKKSVSSSVRNLISRALQDADGQYPQAAEWFRTTPRVLRYLHDEKQA